jgi:hypothetical protein
MNKTEAPGQESFLQVSAETLFLFCTVCSQPSIFHGEHSPCSSEARCQPYSTSVNTSNWGTLSQLCFTYHRLHAECLGLESRTAWMELSSLKPCEFHCMIILVYDETTWFCYRKLTTWNKHNTALNINYTISWWNKLPKVQLINVYNEWVNLCWKSVTLYTTGATVFNLYLCLCTEVNINIIHYYFCKGTSSCNKANLHSSL